MNLQIGDTAVERIADILPLRDSNYAGIDVAQTIDYFFRFFVRHCPLRRGDLTGCTIGDLGAGFGWLAIAFAWYTGARVVAVEINDARVEGGRQIAELLGIADRIDWRTGDLGRLPLTDRELDVSYAVEVLEHVGGNRAVFSELARVTRQFIVLSTPNLLFPVVAHDTRLPLCHWLPMRLRDVYARLAGRAHLQHGNRFWSPFSIRKSLPDFRREHSFMQCGSVEEYLSLYPTYLPYNGGGRRDLSVARRAYCRGAGMLGRYSDVVLPNVAGVYRRVRE